jgi:hypothetical protein
MADHYRRAVLAASSTRERAARIRAGSLHSRARSHGSTAGHAGRRRCGPAPPFTPLAESFPLQRVTDGARRRPVLFRRPGQQLGVQFLRSPARMLPPQPHNRVGLGRGDCPRHHARCALAFCKPGRPLRPGQPLVAGLAAHPLAQPVLLSSSATSAFTNRIRNSMEQTHCHGMPAPPALVALICYLCCRFVPASLSLTRGRTRATRVSGGGSPSKFNRYPFQHTVQITQYFLIPIPKSDQPMAPPLRSALFHFLSLSLTRELA